MYGGKNCSVRLTACESHQCQNNATCMPQLLNEPLNIQNYTCRCLPGFAGNLCQRGTSASFLGNAWMRSERTSGRASILLEMDFRTTLTDGLLFINLESVTKDYMYLELVQASNLRLVYYNQINNKDLSVKAPNNSLLNDGNWKSVSIQVNYTRVELSLLHSDCPEGVCSSGFNFSQDVSSQHHDLGPTYFGKSATDLRNFDLDGLVPFTGCMRDIQIDGYTIIPEDFLEIGNSVNLIPGCDRTDQCMPDPCSGRGQCKDMWHHFDCDCRRPYVGHTCNSSGFSSYFLVITCTAHVY